MTTNHTVPYNVVGGVVLTLAEPTHTLVFDTGFSVRGTSLLCFRRCRRPKDRCGILPR